MNLIVSPFGDRSWFAFDVVSSIPLDRAICVTDPDNASFLRVFKAFRLLKMFRSAPWHRRRAARAAPRSAWSCDTAQSWSWAGGSGRVAGRRARVCVRSDCRSGVMGRRLAVYTRAGVPKTVNSSVTTQCRWGVTVHGAALAREA